MIRSMTGFASKIVTISSEDGSRVSLIVSIKSLNSRFFEATCKLHYQLSNLETDITKLLKHKLYRGHVYFTAYANSQTLFKGNIEPSFSIIGGYVEAMKQAQQKFGIQGALSVDGLLQLPNIFSVEEKEIDQKVKDLLFTVTEELIERVIEGQNKEGTTLAHDIRERITVIRRHLATIEQSSAVLIEAQKDKLRTALADLASDENKLAELERNTAYVLLDKMDINEEIVRFKSHLDNMLQHLDSPVVEKGKRLDFTLQELAREINTIAAKCSDATIGAAAIEIKVELEKAREQVQNIV